MLSTQQQGDDGRGRKGGKGKETRCKSKLDEKQVQSRHGEIKEAKQGQVMEAKKVYDEKMKKLEKQKREKTNNGKENGRKSNGVRTEECKI